MVWGNQVPPAPRVAAARPPPDRHLPLSGRSVGGGGPGRGVTTVKVRGPGPTRGGTPDSGAGRAGRLSAAAGCHRGRGIRHGDGAARPNRAAHCRGSLPRYDRLRAAGACSGAPCTCCFGRRGRRRSRDSGRSGLLSCSRRGRRPLAPRPPAGRPRARPRHRAPSGGLGGFGGPDGRTGRRPRWVLFPRDAPAQPASPAGRAAEKGTGARMPRPRRWPAARVAAAGRASRAWRRAGRPWRPAQPGGGRARDRARGGAGGGAGPRLGRAGHCHLGPAPLRHRARVRAAGALPHRRRALRRRHRAERGGRLDAAGAGAAASPGGGAPPEQGRRPPTGCPAPPRSRRGSGSRAPTTRRR